MIIKIIVVDDVVDRIVCFSFLRFSWFDVSVMILVFVVLIVVVLVGVKMFV